MLKFTSLKDGSLLEFENESEAAHFFTRTGMASGYDAALLNIRRTLKGWQRTGGTRKGLENRLSSYGYSIKDTNIWES